ncbi:50S ribosomal protein P1 [Candidatus Woesearchaeota archaeon]|nr:50S ribosomal protein P1 [Candidatus Woesearchaeota archaeon]
MEYIYSALLLHKVGKKVEESRVKAILNAAGVTPDEGRIKVLLAALDGVNIDEAIASANMPLATTQIAASESVPVAKKKEEKKDEGKSAEEASAGLAGLFG